MPDVEKVIKGLETCYCLPSKCEDCPYHDLPDEQSCKDVLCLDAIALLKEQEAREPHYTTLRYLVDGIEVAVRHPECPRCIEKGLMLWDAEIEKGQAFCKRCGQAVKWDD